jgi:hypothetical protein
VRSFVGCALAGAGALASEAASNANTAPSFAGDLFALGIAGNIPRLVIVGNRRAVGVVGSTTSGVDSGPGLKVARARPSGPEGRRVRGRDP